MLQCLIFDMDDTLYDEIDYCRSGFKVISHAIAAMQTLSHRPAISSTEIFNFIWQQFTLGQRQNLFNITLDNFYLPYSSETIADLVQIYRNHRPIITLDPADAAILSQLKQNYKLGLLSDGFLPAQQYKVEALGLNQYFDAIVFTESLGRQYWKPSAAGYQQILQNLDIKTNDWAYIGDNEAKDFIYPNQAGAVSVQLKRPNKVHFAPAPDAKAHPQYIINNLSALPDLIRKI